MTEQPTGIADLLGESLAMSKPVRTGGENQRVTAANADVLMHAVAVGQTNIGMVAKETGERVPNVRSGSILAQILRAAAAPPGSAGRPPEHPLSTTCPHKAQLQRTSGARGSQDCLGDRLSFHMLLYTS